MTGSFDQVFSAGVGQNRQPVEGERVSVYDNDTGEMCPGCVLEATDDQITVRCDDGVDGYYSPGYLTWGQDAWTDLSHHRSVGC